MTNYEHATNPEDNPGLEFPFEEPELEQWQAPAAEEVLADAGFEPGQYVLHPGVGYFLNTNVRSEVYASTSYLKEAYGALDPEDIRTSVSMVPTRARKDHDGIWHVAVDDGLALVRASSTPRRRDDQRPRLGPYNGMEHFQPVLATMGVSRERISMLDVRMQDAEKAVDERNVNNWKTFEHIVASDPVANCLPRDNGVISQLDGRRWVSRAGLDRLRMLWPQAAELNRLQDSGEILVNWGGQTKDTSRFVLSADGVPREPDHQETGRSRNRNSAVYWDIVEPDEVALHWQGSKNLSADRGQWQVAKMPVHGLTDGQQLAIRSVEDRLGLYPNAFLTDPTLNEVYASRAGEVDAILADIGVPRADGGADAAAFLRLVGYSGEVLDLSGMPAGVDNPFTLTDWSGEFPEVIANRPAQVVREYGLAAGGALQFLTYEKFGDQQCSVRWVEQSTVDAPDIREAEASAEIELSEQEVTLASLQALKDRFGR